MSVVDADGHVMEPLRAWDAIPEDQRLRVVRDAHDLDHVIVADQEIALVSLGRLGTPDSPLSDLSTSPRLEDAHPGGFDARLRLPDMDSEGIDVAVLYPTIGLNFWAIADVEAAVAHARAYNDWLAEYCAVAPDRLFGAAMVPMQDPDAAVHELRRAHDDLGFRAAFLRPNPCLGRSITDAVFEPFWSAAEELEVTIGIHEGSAPAIETLGDSRRPWNPLVMHAVSHAFEQMYACAQIISTGVLERHPDLHVAFLEAGGAWAPYWLWRLDEQVHGFGGFCPEMRLLPSEYFARQCWVSFEIDEPLLPVLLPHLGTDRVIWGSDYPHHDSTFPGAVDALRATIAPLDAAVQAQVLGGNARALYRMT